MFTFYQHLNLSPSQFWPQLDGASPVYIFNKIQVLLKPWLGSGLEEPVQVVTNLNNLYKAF